MNLDFYQNQRLQYTESNKTNYGYIDIFINSINYIKWNYPFTLSYTPIVLYMYGKRNNGDPQNLQNYSIVTVSSSQAVFASINNTEISYISGVTSNLQSQINNVKTIIGPTGATGSIGATGSSGINGTNGINGSIGSTGSTGGTGSIGQQGINGIQGSIGSTGSTGPTGTVSQNTNDLFVTGNVSITGNLLMTTDNNNTRFGFLALSQLVIKIGRAHV